MSRTENGADPTSNEACAANIYNYNTNDTDAAVNDQSVSGMHPRLLKACRTGNYGLFDYLYDHLVGPDILKDRTPYGNTALHLVVMLGYETFAKKLWLREPSLLTSQNNDGETPLIAALMAGNKAMARALIAAASSSESPIDDLENRAVRNHLCEMLEKMDLCGQNALHHALRSMPDQELALHILDKAKDHHETVVYLSSQVSNYGESPMHIACRRGYPEVVDELLKFPDSSDEGPNNTTAMHAAVVAQQIGIVNKLFTKRPQLARRVCNGDTPLTLAISTGNLEMVETFMRHDPSLAYIDCEVHNSQDEEDESHDHIQSPFLLAVRLGRVEIAKEIASHCPDIAYCCSKIDELNALHQAVKKEHPKMVEYLLHTPQFRRLVNQADLSGKLPLHHAAEMCNTELLRSLLNHEAQDCTAVTVYNQSAFDLVYSRRDLCATHQWNNAYTLLSHKICFGTSGLLEHRAKKKKNVKQVEEENEENIRYLMPCKNAFLMAILIVTITFVAVISSLHVPEVAYNTNANVNGLAVTVLATKQLALFKVFLITYTIAMLCSLALCFFATYMRENYKAGIWIILAFGYVATTVAFVSGMYLVAPTNLWLVLIGLTLIISIILVLIRFRFRFNISDIWSQSSSRSFSSLHRYCIQKRC